MKRVLIALWAVPLFSAAPARADTVYLKNGEWIDGVVSLRTNTFIELQIGDIGKIDLPMEEVHSIEKNSRRGGRTVESYVEPKGRTEVVGPRVKGAEEKAKAIEERARKEKEAGKKDDGSTPSKPHRAEGKDAPEESAEEEAAGEKEEPEGEDKNAPEIEPELKKRIEELVEELERQKSRNRVQAERHLEAIGQPAIPFLIPVAKSKNDLTRVAVMRLFHSFGDDRVMDASIEALLDDNEYVRDYANRTLKRVSGEDFGYQPNSSPRRREVSQRKWTEWWDKEKKVLADERKLSRKHR